MATDPALLPSRVLCNIHATRPDLDCRRCVIALDLTVWNNHQQDLCDPATCPHCDFESGGVTGDGELATAGD